MERGEFPRRIQSRIHEDGAGLGGIAEAAEVKVQELLAALRRYGAEAVGGRHAFTC